MFKSDNMDIVILVALRPLAAVLAPIFVAKKYVLLVVSIYLINHPFTSCPSTRPS